MAFLGKNFIGVKVKHKILQDVFPTEVHPEVNAGEISDWVWLCIDAQPQFWLPCHPFKYCLLSAIAALPVADCHSITDRKQAQDRFTPAIIECITVSDTDITAECYHLKLPITLTFLFFSKYQLHFFAKICSDSRTMFCHAGMVEELVCSS